MTSTPVRQITVSANGKTATVEFSDPQMMTADEVRAYGQMMIEMLQPTPALERWIPYPYIVPPYTLPYRVPSRWDWIYTTGSTTGSATGTWTLNSDVDDSNITAVYGN